MSTDDLVTWLTAQVDEDERVARAASSRLPGADRWVAGPSNADGVRTEAGTPVTRHSWPNEMEHIARWDPARVLVEVEAKRVTLELHQSIPLLLGFDRSSRMVCQRDEETWPCADVCAVALPYRNAPGYRPEWASEVTA